MTSVIHKEYQRLDNNIRVAIYTDNYGASLKKFNDLYEIARGDFPKLEYKDIEVVVYGGDRIKYHFGIEFNLEITRKMPEDYLECQLEFTLA